MALQKNKNSGTMSAVTNNDLFGLDDVSKPVELTGKSGKEEYKPIATTKSSKRFDSDVVIKGNTKTILSAGVGSITNDYGPKQQIGMNTWNNLEEIKNTPSNREKTIANANEIKRLRNGLKEDRLSKMVEAAQGVDTRNGSTVMRQSTQSEKSVDNTSYIKNRNSIFDVVEGKEAFAGIPEKTTGENLSEIKDRQVDKSCNVSIPMSTKKITSKMFDNLGK